MINIHALHDDEIKALVHTYDVLGLPMNRRFEGDDDVLVNFLDMHGLAQDVATKLLITGLAMREALVRGIQIKAGN